MKSHEVVDRVAAIPANSVRLWSWMLNFESTDIMEQNTEDLLLPMLPHMRETVLRIAPLVAAWLDTLSDGSGK